MLARLDAKLLRIADTVAARARVRNRWDVWRTAGVPLAGAVGLGTGTAAWGLGVAPQLEGTPYVGGVAFALACTAPVAAAAAWFHSVDRERRIRSSLARGNDKPHRKAMALRRHERENQTGRRKAHLVLDALVVEASLAVAVMTSPTSLVLAALVVCLVAFRYASLATSPSEPIPKDARKKRAKVVRSPSRSEGVMGRVGARIRVRGRRSRGPTGAKAKA